MIHFPNVSAKRTMEWCKSQSQVLFTTHENNNVCTQTNTKTNSILKNNDENAANILDKVKPREIIDAEKCYVCLGDPINIDKLSTYSRKIGHSTYGLNQRYPKRKSEQDNEEGTISQYVGPFNLDYLTSPNVDKIHENDTCLDRPVKKKCKSQICFSKLNVVLQQINPASINPYLKPKPKCKTPVSELVHANVKKHLTECQRPSAQCDTEFCLNCNRKGGSSKRKQPKMTRIDKQTFSMLRYAINKRTMCRRIPVSIRKLLKNNINLIVYSNKRRRYRHKYNKYSIKYVNECWRICRESNSVTKSINRNFRKTKKFHKSQHQKQSSSNLIKHNNDEEDSLNIEKTDAINNPNIVRNNFCYPGPVTECMKNLNVVINDNSRITQNNNLGNLLVNDTTHVHRKGEINNLVDEQNIDETLKNDESTTSNLIVPIKTNNILGISMDDCNSNENDSRDIYNIPEKRKDIMTITLESDNESVFETSEDEEESDSFIIINKSNGNGVQYMSNENAFGLRNGMEKETLKSKSVEDNYSQCHQIPSFDTYKITESIKDIPTITLESDSDSMSEISEDEEESEDYVVIDNRKHNCTQRNILREVETNYSKSGENNYHRYRSENEKDIMTITLESDDDSASETSENEKIGNNNVISKNSNNTCNILSTNVLEKIINNTDQDKQKDICGENDYPQVSKKNQVKNSTVTTNEINQIDVELNNLNGVTTTNSLVDPSCISIKQTNIVDKDVIECQDDNTNQGNLKNNSGEDEYSHDNYLDANSPMNTEEDKFINVEKCNSNYESNTKTLIDSSKSSNQNNIFDTNITEHTKDVLNRNHIINDSRENNCSFEIKNNLDKNYSITTEAIKHTDIEKCNSNDVTTTNSLVNLNCITLMQKNIVGNDVIQCTDDVTNQGLKNNSGEDKYSYDDYLDENSPMNTEEDKFINVEKCNSNDKSNTKNLIDSSQSFIQNNIFDVNTTEYTEDILNKDLIINDSGDKSYSVTAEAIKDTDVEKCNSNDESSTKKIVNSSQPLIQNTIFDKNINECIEDITDRDHTKSNFGDYKNSYVNKNILDENSSVTVEAIDHNDVNKCNLTDESNTKHMIDSCQSYNQYTILDSNVIDSTKDNMTQQNHINKAEEVNYSRESQNSSVLPLATGQNDVKKSSSNNFGTKNCISSGQIINQNNIFDKNNIDCLKDIIDTDHTNALESKTDNTTQDDLKNNFVEDNYSQENQNYPYENSLVTPNNSIEHNDNKTFNLNDESSTETLIGSRRVFNQNTILQPKINECTENVTDKDNLNTISRASNCSHEIKINLHEESSVTTEATKHIVVENCNPNDKSSLKNLNDSSQFFNQYNISDAKNIEYIKDNTTQINPTNNYSHQNQNHPFKHSVTPYVNEHNDVKCYSNDGFSTKSNDDSSQTFNRCNILDPNEIENKINNSTIDNPSCSYENTLLAPDAMENNYVKKCISNDEFSSEKCIGSGQFFIQNTKFSEDITNQENLKNNLDEKSSLTSESIQSITVEKYKSNFENLIDFSQSFSQNSIFDSNITGYTDDISDRVHTNNSPGNTNCYYDNKNNLDTNSSVNTESIKHIDVEKCNFNNESDILIASCLSVNQKNTFDPNIVEYTENITEKDRIENNTGNGNYFDENKTNLNQISSVTTEAIVQIDVEKCNLNYETTTEISIGSRMSFNQNNILDVNVVRYTDDIMNKDNFNFNCGESNFSYTNKNNLYLNSAVATQEVKQIDVIKSNSNDGQTTKILNITHKSSINTNFYEFPSHSHQPISFPHELHLHKIAMENMTNLTNCIDEYLTCKQLENNSVVNSNLTFDSSLLTDVNVISTTSDENIVTRDLNDFNISSINNTFDNNKNYNIAESMTIEKCNNQLNENNNTNDFEKNVLEENIKKKEYLNPKKLVEDKNNPIMGSSLSVSNTSYEKSVDLTFECNNENSDNFMYYLDNTSNEDVCKMMLDIVKKTYTYSEFLIALDGSNLLQSELNKYGIKLPIEFNNMKLNVMNFIEIYIKWFENECTSKEKCFDKYPVALLKSMISYIVEDSGTTGHISTAKKAIQTLINNFSKEKLSKHWRNKSNSNMSIDNNNANAKGIQGFQNKENSSNTIINSTEMMDTNSVCCLPINNDVPTTSNLFDDLNNLNNSVPPVAQCNYIDNSFNHFEMSNLRSDESNLYEDISDVEEDSRLTFDNTLNKNLSNIADDLMINVNVDCSSLDFNYVCPFDQTSINNTYDNMISTPPADTSYTNNSDNPDMINKMLDLNLTSNHISKIEEERLLMSVCDQSVDNVNENLCVDDLEISTTDDFFSGFDNAGTLCS